MAVLALVFIIHLCFNVFNPLLCLLRAEKVKQKKLNISRTSRHAWMRSQRTLFSKQRCKDNKREATSWRIQRVRAPRPVIYAPLTSVTSDASQHHVADCNTKQPQDEIWPKYV